MMKFWELQSVFRDFPDRLEDIFKTREWQEYLAMQANTLNQRQLELETELPDGLVGKALSSHPGKLFVSKTHIRSAAISEEDQMLSYYEIFQRFGGSIIEEVLEKGSQEIAAFATNGTVSGNWS